MAQENKSQSKLGHQLFMFDIPRPCMNVVMRESRGTKNIDTKIHYSVS